MIEFSHVAKKFSAGPGAVKALTDIDLTIGKSQFVALVGASGSGKSTLLNILGGLETPTAGRVAVDGVDISSLPDAELTAFRRDKLGFVFQNFNLLPYLTAFENVEYPLFLKREPPKSRVEKTRRWLDMVGLTASANQKPPELSGGQRQRVAIARALVHDPVLVLADEPTANLDHKTGVEIISLMKKLNQSTGTTFVLATHDTQIIGLTGRVVEIFDGKIISDTAPLAH